MGFPGKENNFLSVDQLILAIKRRESWWARFLYGLAVKGRQAHVPYVPGLHDLLYVERRLRLHSWRNLKRLLYYEPLMKSRCVSVGKNLTLLQALPLITGNLRIYVGDNVTIDGTNTFAANRIYDSPELRIGSHSFIGWHVTISVGQRAVIGEHCLIGANVLIADNDMHPLSAEARRRNETVAKDAIKPVCIGDDVWIGSGCHILKGVKIGNGSVIGAGSVVVDDVPSGCIAAGNPARIVKNL
jgi:acetyltransferase-like isoleucine patch superfamily enzyme